MVPLMSVALDSSIQISINLGTFAAECFQSHKVNTKMNNLQSKSPYFIYLLYLRRIRSYTNGTCFHVLCRNT